MTWFSLPTTKADNKAAFFDSKSATVWLAGQPQANAPAMLANLAEQIQTFNRYQTNPRERFKTLEVLRKTCFAVSGECQRRYENKPLPLTPVDQGTLDTAHQLWRACAVAYLHCLRACLDHDVSITDSSAKVAHRVLSCLRMEQTNFYLAGAELDGEFWRILHSVWAAVEQLEIERIPVTDRLLGETSESTLGGQYAMVLLLHLARPFTLSRGQFAAASRWFARWREQVKVLAEADLNPKSFCVALDLSQDQPIHDKLRVAGVGRWLSLNDVLHKMRKRVELLATGESPESLKLGSGLSSEASTTLLNLLSEHLKHPQQAAPDAPGEALSTTVASGMENIYQLLGGKRLKEQAASSPLSEEQIAVFGHVVRDSEVSTESQAETWQVARPEPGELHLIRPAGSAETRQVLKGLLAIRVPQHEYFVLATICSLHARRDGSLCVSASLFPGEPAPLTAEIREKPSGKVSRHPAFLLPASEDGGVPSVILPTGLLARALSVRFYEAREQSLLRLRLVNFIERGGDNERWSVATEQ